EWRSLRIEPWLTSTAPMTPKKPPTWKKTSITSLNFAAALRRGPSPRPTSSTKPLITTSQRTRWISQRRVRHQEPSSLSRKFPNPARQPNATVGTKPASASIAGPPPLPHARLSLNQAHEDVLQVVPPPAERRHPHPV